MNQLDREIKAILNAEHTDPFAFLGMHKNVNSGCLVIRAFFPFADSVRLVSIKTNRVVSIMKQVANSGFYVSETKRKKKFDYYYKVHYNNSDQRFDDPYSFGPILGELDLYLLSQGKHRKLYQVLGAHSRCLNGIEGTAFALWAPNASHVSIVGDFNGWDARQHPMRKHHEAGYWDLFIPGVSELSCYKFHIKDADGNLLPLKADPVGAAAEHRPSTASKTVAHRSYNWADDDWMSGRGSKCTIDAPISIYEVHLGSWRRSKNGDFLNYKDIAQQLVPYAKDMGFTHIQLLPISEHPFDGSWGYQPVGIFAPTSRHGSVEDFKSFVESCHQADLGLLIDWVPGHFPNDDHGLAKFDGSHLYEYEDPREGFHPDWNTHIYNFSSKQVSNFLRASAMQWIERYHLDGIRVDAVASMLYRNYSREDGEWIPNIDGGHENYEAIDFLKEFNEELYGTYPGVFSVAEESTAWPNVSRPTSDGGLGFGFKWNMGWMNDSLRYMSREPIYRKHHHDEISFGLVYAFDEQFVLPLSHDEVVHGKGSILGKMPGDGWQQFANVRAYYGFMWTHPGKKLLFMGSEFAQGKEWNHDTELEWQQLDIDWHLGVQKLVRKLNHLYRYNAALHQLDCSSDGFSWVDHSNSEQSIFIYCRYGQDRNKPVIVICNFTPNAYEHHRIGVPFAGIWKEILNTDDREYGGSGLLNTQPISSEAVSSHDCDQSIAIKVPPLATIVLEVA